MTLPKRTLWVWLCLVALQNAPARGAALVDFAREVRPILSNHCFACHGPDEQKRKGKLRLDEKEGIYSAREGGRRVITPKNPAQSELFKRITHTDKREQMPPPEHGVALSAAQVAVIKRWIEEGAPYQSHWAFIAPANPAPPVVAQSRWARNPVDQFIAARIESQKLSSAAEADKPTLLRRVSFDLTGLPPTLAELDAFLADAAPDAYEKAVDRLLKSPRYGEHMARFWLDLARYGDTHGLHLDNERSIWPYRDWVVQAYNQNLPFDQFSTWQIAGDLLPNATTDQIVASGFNRCNVTTSEGGSINEEFVFRYAVDRTDTTVAVWMGLTAGCAVCHDHKFDPISQKEFYSLFSFFHSTADPAMDGNILLTPPVLKLATPDQKQQLEELDKKIAAARQQLAAAIATIKYAEPVVAPDAKPDPVERVWVDDEFPAGAKGAVNPNTQPLKFAEAGAGLKPLSGSKFIQRTAAGVAQDFFTSATQPLVVGANDQLFAYVFLDLINPPKAVMLQFHIGGWNHRGNWGDADAIPYGQKGTTQKLQMGPLPKVGEWVRLEISASKLGLAAGTKIDGMAFTQFGGTASWDKAGITTITNPLEDPARSLAAWERQIKNNKDLPAPVKNALKIAAAKRSPEQQKTVLDHYLEVANAAAQPVLAQAKAQLKDAQDKRDVVDKAAPSTLVMAEMAAPRETFVHVRGQYNKLGEKVGRNVPAVFPPLPSTNNPTRLDLARWMMSEKHPLTARVAVNRYWQQLFGMGLVKTSGDFGSQGEAPSHPELLDWLARHFVASGWDTKALIRLLVTSATYRQDSRVTSSALAADPANRLYARGPRFRLDAEVLRDNALFTSGLLVAKLGGKGVKPYQPENIWEPVGFESSNTRNYVQDHGEALYRRSLYTFIKRTAPPPFMATFDGPNREQSCARRDRSNTPLQALQLLNDIQHMEAARNLAQRLLTEGGAQPEGRLAMGFRIATARTPTPAELAILKAALDRQLARYAQNKAAAEQLLKYGESLAKPELPAQELAAYTMIANLILNLDETVTKN